MARVDTSFNEDSSICQLDNLAPESQTGTSSVESTSIAPSRSGWIIEFAGDDEPPLGIESADGHNFTIVEKDKGKTAASDIHRCGRGP